MKNLTYLLLNAVFMLIVILAIHRIDPNPKPRKHLLLAGVILYLMMVVFNTYLTSLAIVRYDWAKVLGFKIISWPIEDLAYLVVALYAGPVIWDYIYSRYESHNQAPPPQVKGRRNTGTQKTPSNSRRLKAD
jgi:lycopene cyclase domain-containing protein